MNKRASGDAKPRRRRTAPRTSHQADETPGLIKSSASHSISSMAGPRRRAGGDTLMPGRSQRPRASGCPLHRPSDHPLQRVHGKRRKNLLASIDRVPPTTEDQERCAPPAVAGEMGQVIDHAARRLLPPSRADTRSSAYLLTVIFSVVMKPGLGTRTVSYSRLRPAAARGHGVREICAPRSARHPGLGVVGDVPLLVVPSSLWVRRGSLASAAALDGAVRRGYPLADGGRLLTLVQRLGVHRPHGSRDD